MTTAIERLKLTEHQKTALGTTLGRTITQEDVVMESPIGCSVDGTSYWVTTREHLKSMEEQAAFETLLLQPLDALRLYYLQDMDPDQVDIVVNGILIAPDSVLDSYHKNRLLSLVINLERMVSDMASLDAITFMTDQGSQIPVDIELEDGTRTLYVVIALGDTPPADVDLGDEEPWVSPEEAESNYLIPVDESIAEDQQETLDRQADADLESN